MWSSWYLWGIPSNRILIDSSASTIQTYLVLCFPNTAAGFPAAIYWCFTRHCCWHRNFQLSTSVFHGMFKLFIIWFNEEDPPYLSGIIELWFLDGPLLLRFAFCCIRQMLPHIWPYIVGSFFFLASLHPDHVYPSGGLWFNKIILVKPVHASNNSLYPSTLQQSSIFLQQYIQWCMCISGDVDVLQWNRKWFFSWHVQFDSGFHMMAINEILCDISEIRYLVLSPLEEGLEKRVRLVLLEELLVPRSGRSLINKQDVLRRWSPPETDCSICDREYKIVTFHRREHFLCIEPSGVEFWCVPSPPILQCLRP